MALALALGAALGAPPAAAPAPRATAVGVGEREWRISLYRSRVPAGLVRLNVRNFGEDGHDLAVRTPSGRVLGAVAEVRAGGTATLRLRLRAGRYRIFCSLEGHEARGMRALLRVEARRRPRRARAGITTR